MKTFYTPIRNWILAHKILSVIAALIVICIGYQVFATSQGTTKETRYTLTTVEKGTLITSISGTGQIQTSNQVELKTKTSGDLTYLNAKSGQSVLAGALIAQLDASDAQYELASAKISYDQLITIDPDELRRSENTLIQAEESLITSYVNAHTSMVSALSEDTEIIDNLESLILKDGFLRPNQRLSNTATIYRKKAEDSYYDAKKSVDAFAAALNNLSSNSEYTLIQSALGNAYAAASDTAQAAKDAYDTIIYIKDHNSGNQSAAESAYTSISSTVQSAHAVLTNIRSAQSSISNSKNSFENAQADLKDIQDGPDELDIRSQKLSLKQKEDGLVNYSVLAPFAGIIASVEDVHTGESISSGTTIATLITKEKIAEISLNEVDAAKVAVGQKATVTFDALEDLSISGTVAQVDLIGTVSQGVVSYTVKIALDTKDDLIKSGMTASANIIVSARQDVLLIPASALKTKNSISYVEILPQTYPETEATQGVVSGSTPSNKEVETGASNDTLVEIVSGLEEGEQIISKTTQNGSTAISQTQSASSLFGGGNSVRIPR